MKTPEEIRELAEREYPKHVDVWVDSIRDIQRTAYITAYTAAQEDMLKTLDPDEEERLRKVGMNILALYNQKCVEKNALVDRWVSVEDSLPEDGQFYLTCYARNDYYSCEPGQIYTRRDGSKCFVDRNESAMNPTHWQPLPEAPVIKKGEKG